MSETKLEVTQRKIRNGLRKQREAVAREKMKVWNILKQDTYKPDNAGKWGRDAGFFYCPYIPIIKIIDLESTS